MIDSSCVHWWIIGDYLVGHCKKCGATRDFEKLKREEETRKTIHRGKMKSAIFSVLTS